MSSTPIEQLAINTIRTLAMDAVQKANSGHPGTPMALAPVGYHLYQNVMGYDPADPTWPNRDRFLLSVGHASMLLYSLLHLTGVKQYKLFSPSGEDAVPLEQIKQFRQWDSRTPGHPESHLTSGVEVTTGPLGQGVANSVGIAIAQKWQAARYNKPGFDLFTFRTYALAGDGCMMEGVSQEAASLAGHLKLDNLVWLYDSNTITIEGHTTLAFLEDTATRFRGYGWHVIEVKDANDLAALKAATDDAARTKGQPTFILIHSVIAWGSPNKANTHGAHGSPLGAEEIKLTKKAYGWPEDAQFLVPPEVPQHFADGIGKRGATLHAAWNDLYAKYREAHPDLAKELHLLFHRELPDGWDKDLPTFSPADKPIASRESSGKVLNAVAAKVPWLIGGAADLAPSTNTLILDKAAGSFERDNYAGRNFHFGVREHAMGSVVNGLCSTNIRGYGSGFLIFTDYMRPTFRLAALMELPTIGIFTHDSIGVGEDGPTHQPIEQLSSLRAIPGLLVFRPGDANEVVEAWKYIMPLTNRPAVLALSRQALPTIDRAKYAAASGLHKGAYVLADAADGKPDVILLATGSEVHVCLAAYETLTAEGVKARVVSMPCWEVFDQQPGEYRDQVLPPAVGARVGVEQGAELGWHKYVGTHGRLVCMKSFGASAPFAVLQKQFGFTPENVANVARDTLKAVKGTPA